MISDIKVNAKVGEWGPCLRFKSRILRNMFILKKGHQPGVYVPLRALFLVDKIKGGIVKRHFLQICNRVTTLD